jgi:hypothetical protein
VNCHPWKLIKHHHQGTFVQKGRLWSCLQPKGLLGIKTQLWHHGADIGDWYYAQDPTHISIFSLETLQWLAHRLNATLVMASDNVALFSPFASP